MLGCYDISRKDHVNNLSLYLLPKEHPVSPETCTTKCSFATSSAEACGRYKAWPREDGKYTSWSHKEIIYSARLPPVKLLKQQIKPLQPMTGNLLVFSTWGQFGIASCGQQAGNAALHRPVWRHSAAAGSA